MRKTRNTHKKLTVLVAMLAVLTMLFVACGSPAADTTPAPTPEPAATAEATPEPTPPEIEVEENYVPEGELRIGGSSSVLPLMEKMVEGYKGINSGVSIDVSGEGSGAGINGATEGELDIGMSSRELREAELENLEPITIALDGVAVIVHPDNPIADLTIEQIYGIFTGEITKWSEVEEAADGFDTGRTIAVHTRETDSGTRDAFVSITGVGDDMYAEAVVLSSTGDLRQAVSSNEYAIGYISVGSLNDEVKAVTVNGVAPSNDTILDGSYAIQRPFLVCVLPDVLENNNLVKDFISYILSPQGQEHIGTSYVPLSNPGPDYN